jgi:hypothetical protein
LNIWIGVLIALAVAIWVNNDARSRGINGIPWAIVTFLIMIVGLPLYLLVRPNGRLIPCPRCGRKMLIYLSECPHCGTGRVSRQGERTRRKCSFCGRIIEPEWLVCPYCGTKVK